jgi:hypothetical protein
MKEVLTKSVTLKDFKNLNSISQKFFVLSFIMHSLTISQCSALTYARIYNIKGSARRVRNEITIVQLSSRLMNCSSLWNIMELIIK